MRCISIVEIARHPTKFWARLNAIALYEARPRKRDGVYTWRRLKLLGKPLWKDKYAQLEKEAFRMAKRRKIEFVAYRRHGMLLDMSSLELLAETLKV